MAKEKSLRTRIRDSLQGTHLEIFVHPAVQARLNLSNALEKDIQVGPQSGHSNKWTFHSQVVDGIVKSGHKACLPNDVTDKKVFAKICTLVDRGHVRISFLELHDWFACIEHLKMEHICLLTINELTGYVAKWQTILNSSFLETSVHVITPSLMAIYWISQNPLPAMSQRVYLNHMVDAKGAAYKQHIQKFRDIVLTGIERHRDRSTLRELIQAIDEFKYDWQVSFDKDDRHRSNQEVDHSDGDGPSNVDDRCDVRIVYIAPGKDRVRHQTERMHET